MPPRGKAATTQEPPETAAPVLTAAQRINPRLLSGDELKELAYRRGMARSSMLGMTDEKVREQLRYLEAHRAEEESAA